MPSLLFTRFGFYQKAYTFVFVTKGKDCHQHHLLLCMLLRLERKSGIYSRKNAEKQLSECKFMEKQLFWGIEFYHAKLYYTISKMSKNGK